MVSHPPTGSTDFPNLDRHNYLGEQVNTSFFNEPLGAETGFAICFDTNVVGNRMPYPIPVLQPSGVDGTYPPTTNAPPEQATITGLFSSQSLADWTVAVHVAFPDNWDSYWAARADADWPLFTLRCGDGKSIEIRMYRNTETDTRLPPDYVPSPQFNWDRAQTIKAIVRDGTSTTTIAIPDNQFFAHAGSPIWVALSQTSAGTLTISATVGAAPSVVPSGFAVVSHLAPSELGISGSDPNDVSPLLVFSLISDPVGRDGVDLANLLSSAALITGAIASP